MIQIVAVKHKMAWDRGDALQGLMDDRQAVFARLNGLFEIDEVYFR